MFSFALLIPNRDGVILRFSLTPSFFPRPRCLLFSLNGSSIPSSGLFLHSTIGKQLKRVLWLLLMAVLTQPSYLTLWTGALRKRWSLSYPGLESWRTLKVTATHWIAPGNQLVTSAVLKGQVLLGCIFDLLHSGPAVVSCFV